MTNGERIRQKSDEELAKWIAGLESMALTAEISWNWGQWLEWLRQEAQK